LGIILSALALFWAPVGRQLEGAINSSPYLLAIGRLFDHFGLPWGALGHHFERLNCQYWQVGWTDILFKGRNGAKLAQLARIISTKTMGKVPCHVGSQVQ